jgi:hypothetical protein
VGPAVQYWTAGGSPAFGAHGGANTTYFNLAPGGFIMNANFYNQSKNIAEGNWTVYDLTRGTQFNVPYVNFNQTISGQIPINVTRETVNNSIGQFDFLKLQCNNPGTCNSLNLAAEVETSGAYALRNRSVGMPSQAPFSAIINTFVPEQTLFNATPVNYADGYNAQIYQYAPAVEGTAANPLSPLPESVCGLQTIVTTSPWPCSTSNASTTGDSKAPSSGPGSVIGGNYSLYGFAQTAQSLVNNTMTMAYDYWLTLRAITLNGSYAIPADCAIPTPSDAFPAATDYANYHLSANNVEAVYLAYLNAIAREYGQVFSSSVGFCSDPNLGFSFNWTQSWNLRLNITASVYIAGNLNGTNVPLNLNGTAAVGTTYNDSASWPVYNVQPTLLYPYEYQANIPLNVSYPIPVNNPLIGVLVDYKNNVGYGSPAFTPAWGVPTYVSLVGNGNYTNISGTLTNIPSGGSVSKGDAIVITGCVLNGIPQNPCPISTTYFNSFAIGLIHATLPIIPVPGGFGGGIFALGNAVCGTGALNQVWDQWAGYIVSGVASLFIYIGNGLNAIPVVGGALGGIMDAIGCLIGWIVLIVVLVFIAWLVLYIIRIARG